MRALILGLGLNALAPILDPVRADFGFERLAGLSAVGGLSYALLYIPMAVISLLNYWFGRTVRMHASLPAVVLLLGHTVAGASADEMLFAGGHFLVGVALALLIPGLYADGKIMTASATQFQTGIALTILLGLGAACGQYASAIIGDATPTGWRFVFFGLACCDALCLVLLQRRPLETAPRLQTATNRNSFFAALDLKSALLLSQYLPGSIPWGAFTVFIYPYLSIECRRGALLPVTLITVLAAGMVIGSFVASAPAQFIYNRSPRGFYLCLLFSFGASIPVVLVLISISAYFDGLSLTAAYFLAGALLAIPGACIKGALFAGVSAEGTNAVFSLENFLESLGKGLGPAIAAALLLRTGTLAEALRLSSLFWLFCIPPIAILLTVETRRNDKTAKNA